MTGSEPRGRVSGSILVALLALGLVGMGLLVNEYFIAGVVLLILVAGAMFAALREGEE